VSDSGDSVRLDKYEQSRHDKSSHPRKQDGEEAQDDQNDGPSDGKPQALDCR